MAEHSPLLILPGSFRQSCYNECQGWRMSKQWHNTLAQFA